MKSTLSLCTVLLPLLLTSACVPESELEPSASAPGGGAPLRDQRTPRRQKSCDKGLPRVEVHDEVRVIVTCPDDDSSGTLEIRCENGAPVLADTIGNNVLVLCPEDVANR